MYKSFLFIFFIFIPSLDLHACDNQLSPPIKTAWLLNQDYSPSPYFIGFISTSETGVPIYIFDTETKSYWSHYYLKKKSNSMDKFICPNCLKEYIFFKTLCIHINKKHRPDIPDLKLVQLLNPPKD